MEARTPTAGMLRCCDLLDAIPVRIGQVAAWLLVPMVLIILYDVIARRYFRHLDWVIENDLHHFMNSSKIQDSEWHFSAALMFLSMGYAASRNIQIRLDLFREKFTARCRVAVELTGTLVLWLPYLIIASCYGVDYVLDAYLTNEQSHTLTGLPHRWVIKSTLAVGFMLALLAAISLVLRGSVWLLGPPEERRAARLESVSGEIEADQPRK